MSVHTNLTPAEASAFLTRYQIGDLLQLEGIIEGITNSNFLIKTTQDQYVLTIIEDLSQDELPFFVELQRHLSKNGVKCPCPIKDIEGTALQVLKNKPTLLVPYIEGRCIDQPNIEQCRTIGRALSNMHLSAKDFSHTHENSRGAGWRRQTADKLYPVLSSEDANLLKEEMDYHLSYDQSFLPKGIIHADLFRDNALFSGNELTGIIDFYYACSDIYLLDIAIAINDWCPNDTVKIRALLEGYEENRQLEKEEKNLLPSILRLAALRFWLSRMHDYYFPAEGKMIMKHNPDEFKKILLDKKGSSAQNAE